MAGIITRFVWIDVMVWQPGAARLQAKLNAGQEICRAFSLVKPLYLDKSMTML